MANPQKENGFTAIANEIMEALYKANISGQDFRIMLLVLRKTYGFQKIEDAISLSQMHNETGLHHIRCSQVVNRLQLMKILTVTENINGIGKKYKFNKDFELWETVNKNINSYKKMKSTVNVLRSLPLRKTASTKETLTKERLQKKDTYRNNFLIPSLEDVLAYCSERSNQVDAEKWHNYYSSNGWMVGKNKMKDWKAAVRTWEKSENKPVQKSGWL